MLAFWAWAGYFTSLSFSFSCVRWGCWSSSYSVTVIIRDSVHEALNIVTDSYGHSGNGSSCHHHHLQLPSHHHHHYLHYNHHLDRLSIIITVIFIHHHHRLLHCLHHPYFFTKLYKLWSKLISVLIGNISFRKTKCYLFCVCLLETFSFEIIAFLDRILYFAVSRVIAAATTALKGFQGRVNGGMHESEDCSPPVLGLIILFAFNHKSAQRSFAGSVYCVTEPSGTSFEGLWMNSCRE